VFFNTASSPEVVCSHIPPVLRVEEWGRKSEMMCELKVGRGRDVRGVFPAMNLSCDRMTVPPLPLERNILMFPLYTSVRIRLKGSLEKRSIHVHNSCRSAILSAGIWIRNCPRSVDLYHFMASYKYDGCPSETCISRSASSRVGSSSNSYVCHVCRIDT
jgi:hypothetical protein